MNRVIDLRIQPLGRPSGNKPPQKQVNLRVKFKLPRVVSKFDWHQPLHWLVIFALLATITAPIVDALMTHARYDLRAGSKLLGNASPTMAAKISFDNKQQLYQFNKDGIKKSADQSQPNVAVGGDGKLYSADLPVDASKGVKIYDNVNNLTVGFTPQFKTLDGKQTDNRLIYPLDSHSPQLVYTAKANGLKEDLIMPRSVGDSASFKYQLNLGSDLEARLVGGGVGIYSADPTLFGNITFGSDADRAKVEAARKNGAKNYLAFYIPSPQIKQTGKAKTGPSAKFSLDGDILTVSASGLKQAAYPLSIDPSFVVTSSNDLRSGNTEGGIDFDDNNGQILRGGLTGGTVQAFASGGSLVQPRSAPNVAVYNNCFYAVGGSVTGGSYTLSSEYAKLSGGTLSWTQVGNTTGGTAGSNGNLWRPHVGGFGVAYNGYLYVVAGDTGGNGNAGVEVAKINTSDCSIGAWTDTTTFLDGGQGVILGITGGAYNGYIYAVGGYNGLGGVNFNSIIYAKPNPDGTISSWTTSSTTLPEVRSRHATVIYNGFLYITGGMQGALQQGDSAVKYIKINSDGTIGTTWNTTNSMPAVRAEFGMYAHDGYMYAAGGASDAQSTDVIMAPIYANGAIGSWQTTSSMSNTRFRHGAVVYSDANNGAYLYEIGGYNGSAPMTSVEKAKIDNVGVIGNVTWPSGTSLTNTNSEYGREAVVYNGFIYAVGGIHITGSSDTTVEKASIGADGILSSWSGATSLTTGTAYEGLYAYNGYIYAVGGCPTAISAVGCATYTNSTQYAVINADGTLGGSWTTSSVTLPQNRSAFGYAMYNGVLYVAGGYDGSTAYSTILYSKINSSTHDIGAWSAGPTVTGLNSHGSATTYNGFLYVAGGNPASATVNYMSLDATTGAPGTVFSANSMLVARVDFGLAAVKGYIYAWGAETLNSQTNSAEFAKINSDGSLGGWTQTQSENAPGASRTFASDGNALRTINNGGTTQYQFINNSGQGGVGSWATGNTITARGEHGSVVVNGYLYVMGGCITRASGTCKGITSGIQYASVGTDGGVGSWANSTTGLPTSGTGLMDFYAVVYNGRIYVAGGCTTVNTVSGGCTATTLAINFVAPSGSGDITTSWTSNSTLPGSSITPIVAYNGYMYNINGNGTTNGTSYYAAINASTNSSCTGAAGLICSFSSTSSVNTPRGFQSAIYYNGYIYMVSGVVSSVGQNSIEFAKVNSDHTLGTWTQVGTPWVGRQSPVLAAYDGSLCMIAGYNPALGFMSDTWCGSVLANGVVDGWQASTKLSQGLATPGGAQSGGIFYVTGGENGAVGNDVQSATNIGGLRAIPRVGHYSRLFDSDVDVAPTKLVLNGTSGGADDTISATYQTSTSAGNSLANSQTISSITLGTPTAALTTVSGGVARYYWINYTFDDSLSVVFPETTSIQTTLTDFTLYYHPAPSKRLRGGKTFTGNVQQSLDASP